MKRIALQLLLSLALIVQGVSAFGFTFTQQDCCHGEQAAQAHCRQGHGTPCQPDCAQHCLGCITSAFVAVSAFALNASDVSIAVSRFVRAGAHTRGALPPTRPPIV